MKNKTLLIFTCLAFLPLTACKTTVQDGDTKLSVEDGSHHGSGKFCPPGQAKKGNC